LARWLADAPYKCSDQSMKRGYLPRRLCIAPDLKQESP